MKQHLTLNRMIVDWEARGVSAHVEYTTRTEGVTVVPFRKIWLQGPQQAHDLQGVAKFKEGLLRVWDEKGSIGAPSSATFEPRTYRPTPQRLVFPRDLPAIDLNAPLEGKCLSKPKKGEKTARTGRYSQPRHLHRPSRVDWNTLDWSKSNAQLARELKMCPTWVGKNRPKDRRDGLSTKPTEYDFDWASVDWSQKNRVIVVLVGCSLSLVKKKRVEAMERAEKERFERVAMRERKKEADAADLPLGAREMALLSVPRSDMLALLRARA